MDNDPRIPRSRDDLRSFKPYAGGSVSKAVRLAANEWPEQNPAGRYTTPAELDAVILNRYAGPPKELAGVLAERYGVAPDQLAFGNGSNDTLLTVFLTFGGHGRSTLLFQPTYAMYGRLSVLAGGTTVDELIGLPYALSRERALAAMDRARPEVVVFCTPNNPTGTLIDNEVILSVAEAHPETAIVVDEAYSDIGGTTILPAMANHPNLIVSKTFSKVFAAAGLRLGVLILHPLLMSAIRAVVFPFNVSVVTYALAARIARDTETVERRIAQIRSERDRVFQRLRGIPRIETYPSEANFILFRIPGDTAAVQSRFLEKGILIRDMSSWTGCERCLRVSIGSPEENESFVRAAEVVLAPTHS